MPHGAAGGATPPLPPYASSRLPPPPEAIAELADGPNPPAPGGGTTPRDPSPRRRNSGTPPLQQWPAPRALFQGGPDSLEVVEESVFTPARGGGRPLVSVHSITTTPRLPQRPSASSAAAALTALASGYSSGGGARGGARRRSASSAVPALPSGGADAEVGRLRQKLREREDDVLHAVSLGQSIVDDLRQAKRDAERFRRIADAQGDADGLRALRAHCQTRLDALLNVSERNLEERARTLCEARCAELRSEREAQQRRLEELQGLMAAYERDRDRRAAGEAADLQQVAADAARLRTELATARRKAAAATEEAAHLRNLLRKEQQEAAELRERLSDAEGQLESARPELAELRRRLAKQEREAAAAQSDAAAAKRTVSPMRRTLRDTRGDRDRLLAENRALQHRAAELERSCGALRDREGALKQQLSAHTAGHRDAQAELSRQDEQLRAATDELSELRQQTQRLRTRAREAEAERDAAAAALAEAAGAAAAAEGVSASYELEAARERAEEAEAEAADERRAAAEARSEAERLRALLGEARRGAEGAASPDEVQELWRRCSEAERRSTVAEAAQRHGTAAVESALGEVGQLRRDHRCLADQLTGALQDNAALRSELSAAAATQRERPQALAALHRLAEELAAAGHAGARAVGPAADVLPGSKLPPPAAFADADVSIPAAVARVSALASPLADLVLRLAARVDELDDRLRAVGSSDGMSCTPAADSGDKGPPTDFWGSLQPAAAAPPAADPTSPARPADQRTPRPSPPLREAAPAARAVVSPYRGRRREGAAEARSAALRALCDELAAARGDLQQLNAAAAAHSAPRPQQQEQQLQLAAAARRSPREPQAVGAAPPRPGRELRCPFPGCGFASRQSSNLRVHMLSCPCADADDPGGATPADQRQSPCLSTRHIAAGRTLPPTPASAALQQQQAGPNCASARSSPRPSAPETPRFDSSSDGP
eukprot:TRINITY_DN2475_c0_g1_i2.p1 TRINITY_DN2475_c0_g1~~TRINITY_DN2475_c0_g1_i2.p1  ORF type:complete len:979 (+),score=292.98 TRINITY_DN2475_c0_g1_i2:67-2937(+)